VKPARPTRWTEEVAFPRYLIGEPLALDRLRRELALSEPEPWHARGRPPSLPRLALPRSRFATPPTFVEPEEAPDQLLTFIEIELTDEEGLPVAQERYRIELPDGSVREGRLDAKGTALVDLIKPGMCSVTFPDIDGREWQAA
jgi:hypothetical protein